MTPWPPFHFYSVWQVLKGPFWSFLKWLFPLGRCLARLSSGRGPLKLGIFNLNGWLPGLFTGVSSSLLWALLFTLIIVIWAITGDIKGGAKTDQLAGDKTGLESSETPLILQKPEGEREAPFRVRTAVFPVQPYTSKLIIRGRTLASLMIDIRAETAGQVVNLPVTKGTFIQKGRPLCQLEDGARAAATKEARALVLQREADYLASQKLEKRGHTAGLKVLQNKALFDQAQALLERAELDLARTTIKAPFDGFIEEQPAKQGSYLGIGDVCARLVSLDPLEVVGAVRERDVALIKTGMSAEAQLITGERATGKISFIAAAAEEETRTFRIDLLIDNPDGKLRSGVTADILIPLPEVSAMLIPPSILTLSDAGEVGVRLVNEARKVEFRAVDILSEQSQGIWIKALPLSTTIITVGQDFVSEGQKVEPVDDPHFAKKPGF